jgi:hypothetical protein
VLTAYLKRHRGELEVSDFLQRQRDAPLALGLLVDKRVARE